VSRTHVDSGLCDPERRQLDLFFTLRYLRNAVTRSTDCVFEKNYRLQDIQLSKNLLGCGLSAFGFAPGRTSVQTLRSARRAYSRWLA